MRLLRMQASFVTGFTDNLKKEVISSSAFCVTPWLVSSQPHFKLNQLDLSSSKAALKSQRFRSQFAKSRMPAEMPAATTKTVATSSSYSETSILNSLSVAVIGAGAAGLAAARELLAEGHRVAVFEQGNRIGGIWVYEESVEDDLLGINPQRKRLHSSMYAGLRTNLPREVMGYLDFPFDTQFSGAPVENSRDSRRFCSHEEVLLYLEAYAEKFTLNKCIRFNTSVVKVDPIRKSPCSDDATTTSLSWPRWRVSSSSSSNSRTESLPVEEEFDAVLVCNGHYSEPRVPQFPGFDVFPGLQTHSHNYRRPEEFIGKKVVLVGAAFSGMDIAQEIYDGGAAAVYLSAREWEDPTTGEAPDGSGNGAQAPSIRKVGNIETLGADGSVLFEGGIKIENVDVVMYATGYVYRFPFLEAGSEEAQQIVDIDDNRVGPLYKHIVPPKFAPTLAFIGLPWKVVPFPQFQLQSRWIARCLSGKVKLPEVEEMLLEVENYYQWMEEEKLPKRYTHRAAGELQKSYNLWLSHACGDGDLPEWRHELYMATGMARRANSLAFRDTPMEEFAREALKAAAEEAAALRKVAAEF